MDTMRYLYEQTCHLKLAQAYVPIQIYTGSYNYMEGLDLGTIFPELYRPYVETE